MKPMELAADRSACLWILVLSRCQWLYQAANWRFRLFFFFSCFGLLVVVVLLMVVVAMVVRKKIGDLGFFFFVDRWWL